MREMIEFRVPERLAQRYLPAGVGRRLRMGLARELRVSPAHPLFSEIRRIDQQLRAEGPVGVFTCWNIQRKYSRRELEQAELFQVWPRRVFEPAGEECGTVYDETEACGHVYTPERVIEVSGYQVPMSASTCGVGARQVTPLHLDARRIPRTVDFARTIAEEVVVSARVREVFAERGLVGAEFEPVRESNAGGRRSSKYFQLNIVGPRVEFASATRAGANLFDETSYGRCPLGHIIGLNLLSEVHVVRSSLTGADILATRQMVGMRRGLLRPRPILLLSPRAWRAVEEAKLKGLVIEVAHVS